VRTSARPSWLTAGDGNAHVLGKASRRGGAALLRGAVRRRGASHRGGARRAEAAMTTETRGEVRFRGEMDKCRSGRRRGLYRTPPFVMGHIANRDKRPFSPRLYYDPRLKAPFCHGWFHDPDKRGISRGSPLKVNFRLLVPGVVTTRD
jgi:hypothetical protein